MLIRHLPRFQSTLPYGSDGRGNGFSKSFTISIHAPLRERNIHHILLTGFLNFNPRSLTGAIQFCFQQIRLIFISIHAPLRERLADYFAAGGTAISIHAPLRERCIYMITNTITNISIHAPLRERIRYLCADGTWKISIHAPLRERQQPQMFPTQMSDFNPRSLTGATTTLVVKTRSSGFQSTLPYGSEIRYG